MRLSVLVLFASVAGASPALAAPEIRTGTCNTHGEVIRDLSIRFGEIRRDGRVSGADYALEIWSSVFGGWTMLMVRPDGVTCVTTEGDLWPEAPTGDEADPADRSPAPVAPSAKPASLKRA